MKKLIVAVAALTGIPGAAVAADMPTKAPAAQVVASTWTGVYIGVNGGYGWSDKHTIVVTETPPAAGGGVGEFGDIGPRGGFGGLQIGYNYQMGQWVVGVEADAQWSGIKQTVTGTSLALFPGLTATAATSQRINTFGTLRGRLGVTWGPALIYGTGGFAWGQVDHSMALLFSDGFHTFDTPITKMQTGWVAGGGVEYAVVGIRGLSWKLEYQYIDLGSKDFVHPLFSPANASTIFTESSNIVTKFHTVRIGLNYRPGAI